jgi:hypothetical protein
MYKVIIEKVQFGDTYSVDYKGEGPTLTAAHNRAYRTMREYYPAGVQGYQYSTYKRTEGGWRYLQTFGA